MFENIQEPWVLSCLLIDVTIFSLIESRQVNVSIAHYNYELEQSG